MLALLFFLYFILISLTIFGRRGFCIRGFGGVTIIRPFITLYQGVNPSIAYFTWPKADSRRTQSVSSSMAFIFSGSEREGGSMIMRVSSKNIG